MRFLDKLQYGFLGGLALALGMTGSAAAAEFNWRYYSVSPQMHPYSKILSEAFKRIETQSGGRLKIDLVFFGETPYKGSEAEKIMRDGLGDMTEWLLAYSTSTYPLLSGPELPFLPAQKMDPTAHMAAIDKAWESPAVKNNLESILKAHKAVRLSAFYWPPQNHWFRTVVNGPADFKGLKIREYSAEGIDFTKAVGAVPVSLTAPEVYTALQRGTLDGVVTASTSMTGIKWGEVLKAGYISNFKLSISLILVNEKKYNALPDDVKKILTTEVKKGTDEIRSFMVKNEPELLETLKKDYQFKIVDTSPADYAALRKIAMEQVWPNWLQRVGPDGKAVLNDVLSALGAKERM